MAVVQECHFVVPLALKRRRYETEAGFAIEGFLHDLCAHPSFFRLDMSGEEVAAALAQRAPESLAEAVRAIYAAYAARRGKSRSGDKTPSYVMHLDLLGDLFPEARFVHVIRDGRDSALSYLDASFGPTTVAEAALYWRRSVRRGRRTGRALGAARYHEVRYERFVAEPERELRTVCSFLELPFDEAMLRYPDRAAELVGTAHHNLARPPTVGMRDWKRDMPPDDVALFEALAGDLLGELDYERAYSRVPVAARLRALRARAGLGFAQAKRKPVGGGKDERP